MNKKELLSYVKKAERFGFDIVSDLINERPREEDSSFDKKTALKVCHAAAKFGSAFAEEMIEHPEHFEKEDTPQTLAAAINEDTKRLVGHDFKPSVQPVISPELKKEESTAIADMINQATCYLVKHEGEDQTRALDRFAFLQAHEKEE